MLLHPGIAFPFAKKVTFAGWATVTVKLDATRKVAEIFLPAVKSPESALNRTITIPDPPSPAETLFLAEAPPPPPPPPPTTSTSTADTPSGTLQSQVVVVELFVAVKDSTRYPSVVTLVEDGVQDGFAACEIDGEPKGMIVDAINASSTPLSFVPKILP
jgi:hypothetical protein